MLLFDCHLDLSLNAVDFNRDLRQPVAAIREEEQGMTDKKGRGAGTVAFPEMRRGGVGLCVATLIAGCMKPGGVASGWNSPQQAWAQTQAQLAWYRAMEEAGEMRQIRNLADLNSQLELLGKAGGEVPDGAPIGYVLSLEGADSILTPGHLERAWEAGLRAIGPAHYGVGRYALGHDQEGPLSPEGEDLVKEMDRLGFILDVTHLCDRCFWDALDNFDGPVWASHSNCRALVPDPRQFEDDQIEALVERGAVIGAVFDTWMMAPGWVRGKTVREEKGVTLEHIVEHIDHICQIAGNALHVGIGSDLDGGFGLEQSPLGLDTIADLQKLAGILSQKGYSEADVKGIFHGNYLRFLREAWAARR